MKAIPAPQIVYVDDCGVQEYLYRKYAYSPRGQKVLAKVSGKKFNLTNIMAGICQNKWVAPLEYSCSTDSALFEKWFEECLIKEVQPESVIVLDNATFHRKSVLPLLAKKKNCQVLFLPPYSLDLNPIEKKWACLKKTLHNILPHFSSFDFALCSIFQVV